MRIIEKLVVGGVLGCATLVMPGKAGALSCAINSLIAPEAGAVGVPTNTLLWSSQEGTRRLHLIGPAGEVPLEERQLLIALGERSASAASVLKPTAELQGDTLYRVEFDDDREIGYYAFSFTTGSGPSSVAPPKAELLSSEPGGSKFPSTPESRYVTLQFAFQGILIGESGGTLGQVESLSDLLVEGAAPRMNITPQSPVVRWIRSTTDGAGGLALGQGPCMVWPDDDTDRQQARFGVFDLAGNFSGWTETREVVLPSWEEARAIINAKGDADETSVQRDSSTEAQSGGCSLGRERQRPASLASLALSVFTLGVALAWRRRQLP
jgi:hypothetical protein